MCTKDKDKDKDKDAELAATVVPVPVSVPQHTTLLLLFCVAFLVIFAISITIAIPIASVSAPSIPITGSSSSNVTALEVNPEVVLPGGMLSISGKASANDEIWINSVFELSMLPTDDARYTREFTGIYFPAGGKRFSLTAENVENIRISLYPVFVFWRTVEFPLDGPLNATDGIATISIAFPVTWRGMTIDISGEKNVNVFGDAVDNVTPVNLQVTMAVKVVADDSGNFSLEIDTGGVPEGEFLISAGELTRVVYIGTPPPATTIFDTDAPANPFPSIAGTHTGTITPDYTITVTRLYTYAISGTGGHTRYARIANATATWDRYGYVDDWRYITFDKPVVLLAGRTYNFTIRTGSYPQIHHTPALQTANGWINCTGFIDVNGRTHQGWIPAIKLLGVRCEV
ncbi:MAG: hypothetical protein H0M93_04645 [Methanophagales archaeon]|nr:hypothetical protein [Methanophagales archaeon]